MKSIQVLFSRPLVLIFAVVSMLVAVNAQTPKDSDLSGTYRLDRGQSDNVSAMVENIARTNRLSDSEKETLEDQLTAPEMVTIGLSGNSSKSVTLKTSSSSEMTIRADGRSQVISQDDGSQASVTASLRNGVLRLSRVTGAESYSITFASESSGNALRVTRMITKDYLDSTIYADSFYTRDTAYSGVSSSDDNGYSSSDDSDTGYSSSDPNDNSSSTSGRKYPTTKSSNGRFIVPSGVELIGILDNKVTTKASQNNDRFSMSIESPGEYRNAVISGYLSDVKRTGRISGSSTLTFNFETIELATGEVYDFAGVLKGVTDSTGKIIKIGEEGGAKGNSRTKESVKRGGIGAGLGAIIGAIIGGGKGAIIGATIGGGAGAGSVIAEGRDDIELLPGSKITVESSSPNTDRR